MKIILFLSFSILFSTSLFSQERQLIKGKLLYKNTVVVAANVVNNTAQTNTITNSDGEFEIKVAEGDEIIFSSVQYLIRSVKITQEILTKNRLVVSVNENITELKEVVVTTEDKDRFLDLLEEEFKGFDYDKDKSTRINNKLTDDRLITNGIDFVNIAKLISKALSSKSKEEQMKMKPSEVLPLVFETSFFENDLSLRNDQVIGFLEYIDAQMKTSELLKQSKQFQLIDYLINKSKMYKNILSE
ncbi:MAG: carboxypeptidase-like regulatory domain-containing protein [Flavobacteriaceae bacterium]|nr:carboxypeptidase-like regulatory domain-containing protein [Flavobacteriaceae bacterium]